MLASPAHKRAVGSGKRILPPLTLPLTLKPNDQGQQGWLEKTCSDPGRAQTQASGAESTNLPVHFTHIYGLAHVPYVIHAHASTHTPTPAIKLCKT